MNFKPSTLKVIIAVLVGVFFGYFGVGPCGTTRSIAACPYIASAIFIVLIYVFWSLIENKK
jgi:hypothetical protein